MKIIVTGSRKLTDRKLVALGIQKCIDAVREPKGLELIELVHGCANGADMLADSIIREVCPKLQIEYCIHPFKADWKQYNNAAGPIRNELMVDAHKDAHIGLAFWNGDTIKSGTFHCMNEMRKRNIHCIVIWINK